MHPHPELLALLMDPLLGFGALLDFLPLELLIAIDAGLVEGDRDHAPHRRLVEDGLLALLNNADELVASLATPKEFVGHRSGPLPATGFGDFFGELVS